MNLTESAPRNFKSFEETISKVMDGRYDEFSTMLLQIKCKTIKMDAEIAMTLYPEGRTSRCLELYLRRITKCLDLIRENQRFANDLQLEKLDVVYGKLFRLRRFIGEVLVEGGIPLFPSIRLAIFLFCLSPVLRTTSPPVAGKG
jgi:hypothetical protein